VLPALISSLKAPMQFAILAMMIANMASHAYATWKQCKVDSKLSLSSDRNLFPVLEAIEQKDCVISDTVGIVIHTVVNLFIFGVIIYYYNKDNNTQ